MARKPAVMYRQVKGMAFTRRKYMGGVPNNRITQYDMGNVREEFPIVVSLKVKNRVQVRHTALEAGRIAANRFMNKYVGIANYHLKVRVYPHNVLRENKLATGAGADRVSSGMRAAFGKNVGTAARMERDQAIMTIRCNPSGFNRAKKALWKAAMKYPTPCYIEVEQGQELVK
ncbi:MAG: 50S ribosomal protein L16 [Thermoplasmatales archaeon]|nr:50S ribosomal protein L16 [Thermoplasmatales archaeon]